MVLPYKTWEWLAPTVLLTAWFIVPVVTVELFLSGIHNEVKDNLLKSKTTMKRLKSNVRLARELNESDDEDLDFDIQEEERDDELEYGLQTTSGEGETIEVDVETPLEGRRKANGASRSKKGGSTKIVMVEKEKVHFPMDPRLNPQEHLFMRGLTDLIISRRVAGQNKLRQNAPPMPARPGSSKEGRGAGHHPENSAKGTLFVTYMRTKKILEGLIFLYEAFNLWSCLFVSSVEWPKLAPTEAFAYGSFKSLHLYKGMYNGGASGERIVFYLILVLFFIAACCMLVKDATVGPKLMQKHNIALRNRLVTSANWNEFFFGRAPIKSPSSNPKSNRITVVHGAKLQTKGMDMLEFREIRFHLAIFMQYLFFEFLFMPGLSVALVVLNCQPAREDALDPDSRRVYLFTPSSLSPRSQGNQEYYYCWEGGHGVDSVVGVFMAVLIYTCAIYHKRQKMRKASTVVYNLIFEIFYAMVKALLTVVAVCYSNAQNGSILLWGALACFVVLEVVNHLMQPCKGYGTMVNSCRASTFAIGTVTSVLAILVTKYFESDATKNISAAIWIAMLFPVSGFAYEYNMLSASLAKGDVPEDKTIADLLQFQERGGRKSAIVGGLNVQRIAGSCVARLFHIDPRARDVAVLSQIMLHQSTKSRMSLGNLNHGLSGVFGFFSPSEVGKNVALTASTIAREDGDYLLSQELDSRSGVRRVITREQGRILAGHVLQNNNIEEVAVNASRLLYPIPLMALKEGKIAHFDWFDASAGESEILKAIIEYVYSTFSAKALPKTISFGKSTSRIARLMKDFDLEGKVGLFEQGPAGLVQIDPDCVTVDVASLIDPLDFDTSGREFTNAFALDLSQHFLTTADMIVLVHLMKPNNCLQSLDLSDNCLDAQSLPLLSSLFEAQKESSRLKELHLFGNPLSREHKLDWTTGRETIEENWDEIFKLGQTLAQSKSLTSIKMERSEPIDLSEAAKMTRLKLGGSEFDFDSRIGDMTVVMLSSLLPRFGNLYELDLSKNDITDKGVHYLTTRALNPDFAYSKVYDHGWVCRVTNLNLAENKIGDEGLVSLSTVLKRNEFVTRLDLSRNKFSALGLQFLSKGLIRTKYSNLQELHLEDNGHLGPGALDSVLEVLSRKDPNGSDSCMLKSLSLSGIKLYCTGCAKVGEMLSVNQTLEVLSLSGCDLDREPPTPPTADPKLARSNRSRKPSGDLTTSTSKKTGVRVDTGLRELCKSLRVNSSLRVLDVSSNHLVTQEFVAMVIYLSSNPNTVLEHLKVNDNNIGISMAQFRPLIIEEVLTNKALQRIDLHSNPTERGVNKELCVLMSRKKDRSSQMLQFGN
ncbi:hypothetical protein HOP50_20g86320 [Chloropicon primus]|uniref:Leucine-rich repeat domain-containing protein n=1 Tax=Chloropicon primus TaxID=1764295 RepID=A0A5B8N0L4_9CHLO|nr:hypothetical protein A3770_20p85990 [Chloropicon primus]UPR05282.1 hypothetical protein HOP50_20g86320 [Chloropicon primus]|eukprot:QDZ26081.1 hypothetical protein A3770_20p85990 [Chloropicon primus]